MLALPVSTFIETADICLPTSGARTAAGRSIEEIVDRKKFRPQFVKNTSTGGELPTLTASVDTIFDKGATRLRHFKKWQANWDGEGGAQPDPALMDKAILLLSLLSPTPLNFGVGLDSDSRPTFTLRDRSTEGHIAMERDGTVSFYFQRGSNVLDDYELAFDGRTLPPTLEQALKNI